MAKPGYVHILASRRNGTLYVGVTSDLVKRVWQQKNGELDGFTRRYKVTRLVYYEAFDEIAEAISREKAIKKWRRKWKLESIEERNPDWCDLYENIARFPLSRERPE